MTFQKRISLAGAIAILSVAMPVVAQETFTDDFSGTALKPGWSQVLPAAGPTISVADGRLKFTLPNAAFDEWEGVSNAPRILLPAPDGDWTVTARLESVMDPAGTPLEDLNYHTGIIVVLGERDVIMYGPHRFTHTIRIERTAASMEAAEIEGLPAWIQVKKQGNDYHFLYRDNDTDPWSEIETAEGEPAVKTITKKPVSVGLFQKSWAAIPLVATWTDFSLEAADLNYYGVLSGTVNVSGGTAAGLSVQALDADGRVIGTTPVAANGAYSLSILPGTYTLRLTGGGIDSPISATEKTGVTATEQGNVVTDFAVATIPTLSLASASLPQGAAGWKIETVDEGNFDAAKINYDESTMTDVTVPSNVGGGVVADNTDFVYRLRFDVPDDWVGKDLLLHGFDLDDGDLGVYMNEQSIGTYAEATGGPAAPWTLIRSYVVPGSAVKKSNVLAIFGHQGGGGAGIVNNGPILQPLWSSRGIVTGKLVDTAGQPVAGGVTLLDASGKVAGIASSSGPLSGSFILSGLAPGTYKLDDFSLRYSGAPETITVEGGKVVALPNLTPMIPPFFEDTTTRPMDDDFSGTTLDSKWKQADIGNAVNGAAAPSGGVLNVAADGSNIWRPDDNFHYVYQPISGDFIATLQVVAIPDNRDWELAGLMVRKTLDPNSTHAFNQITHRHTQQSKIRPDDAGQALDNPSSGPELGSDLMPNAWVKIKRRGNQVAFYWTNDPTATPRFAGVYQLPGLTTRDVLVGIAAASLDASAVDEGFQFDNFKVIPIETAPPVGGTGDINADGRVNVQDATLALRMAVGLLPDATAAQKAVGDMNNDGRNNVQDATAILRKAVGLG